MFRLIFNNLAPLAIVACVFFALSVGVADDTDASAQNYVEELVTGMVDEVTERRDVYINNEKRLQELITNRIIPSVDVPLIGRLVLGKHWNTANDTQRKLFTDAFQMMLINLYGKSLAVLAEVDSVRFISSQKLKGGKYQVIVSQFTFKGGEVPLEIKYSVKPAGDKWQIFDLIIDGSSIAKQLRQNFNQEIVNSGLDALIARLNTTYN